MLGLQEFFVNPTLTVTYMKFLVLYPNSYSIHLFAVNIKTVMNFTLQMNCVLMKIMTAIELLLIQR